MYPSPHNLSWFILDDQGEPVRVADLDAYAAWFSQNQERRQVRNDWVGEWNVSTIFLGLDHSFVGAAILWETMVFNGPYQGQMMRCGGARADAELMHQQMVDQLTAIWALAYMDTK